MLDTKIPEFVTNAEPVSRKTWLPIVNNYEESGHYARSAHIAKKGFSILTLELRNAFEQILGDRRAVDVGCGSGYLSMQLGIVGVDNFSSNYATTGAPRSFVGIHSHVINCDVAEHDLSQYEDILMSWPDYESDFAVNVARRLLPGQRLFYCGEGGFGCTANEAFFELLHSDFNELEELSDMLDACHVSFYGMHDRWKVYMQKQVAGK